MFGRKIVEPTIERTNTPEMPHRPQNPSPHFPELTSYFTSMNQILESKDSDKSLKYIISQNDEFHQKHENFLDEIKELKVENDEITEDNGRLETDKIRLKGIAMNEAQKTKAYKRVTMRYANEIKRATENHENMDKLIRRFTLFMGFLQFVYVPVISFVFYKTVPEYSLNSSIPLVLGVLANDVFVFAFFYKFVKDYYQNSLPFKKLEVWSTQDQHNSEFHELNKDLKDISELEKGSEYLEMLIDS